MESEIDTTERLHKIEVQVVLTKLQSKILRPYEGRRCVLTDLYTVHLLRS